MPKTGARRATSPPMLPSPTIPRVAPVNWRWARSMRPHPARTRCETLSLGLAADRFPASSRLVANVKVQVSREAQDVAVHLIRNNVGEQAPHVRQYARVRDQCRKKVVLETGGGRLDPAETASPPPEATASVCRKMHLHPQSRLLASLSSTGFMTDIGPAASRILPSRSGSTGG